MLKISNGNIVVSGRSPSSAASTFQAERAIFSNAFGLDSDQAAMGLRTMAGDTPAAEAPKAKATKAPAQNNKSTARLAPSASPQEFLGEVQVALQNGVIPSLQDMSERWPALEPESPMAQALNIETARLLQSAGPAGEMRAGQLLKKNAMNSLDNIIGALENLGKNLEPESPQAQQLSIRISGINAIKSTLNQQLNHDLANDPSQGQAINLRPPAPPQQYGMLAMLQNMMQMLMQMLGSYPR